MFGPSGPKVRDPEMQVDMQTRRQEKVARIVKEAVSDAIANHLNDPRIDGFVSVTRVEMASDLRSAEVYLSVFAKHPSSPGTGETPPAASDAGHEKTFAAINHAKSKIQSLLAHRLHSKFCPVLRFHPDEKFKKVLEIMRLIEQASGELKRKESGEAEPE
jgi:ribosome-binding factor A